MINNLSVVIDQNHVHINFNVEFMDLHPAEKLRAFLYTMVRTKFYGQKLSDVTAVQIRDTITIYTPLIYLLLKLGVKVEPC